MSSNWGGKVKIYIYKVIRENLTTGKQGKRFKKYITFQPKLKVGGLYLHLGSGYPGAQRVLEMEEKENLGGMG